MPCSCGAFNVGFVTPAPVSETRYNSSNHARYVDTMCAGGINNGWVIRWNGSIVYSGKGSSRRSVSVGGYTYSWNNTSPRNTVYPGFEQGFIVCYSGPGGRIPMPFKLTEYEVTRTAN